MDDVLIEWKRYLGTDEVKEENRAFMKQHGIQLCHMKVVGNKVRVYMDPVDELMSVCRNPLLRWMQILFEKPCDMS